MSTTTLTVSTEQQLNQAILTADAATSGHYTIEFAASITEGTDTGQNITFGSTILSAPAELEALNLASGVSVTIDGGGATLNGAGNSALFVYAGDVSIENLTIADAVAQGGSGSDGGGGGAGLGGGLFIAAGGDVTLSSVNFTNDSAIGGNGAHPGSGDAFNGGGGGLDGGNGGGVDYYGNAGGGGGVGAGANGGSFSGTGDAGIIPGAAGGGIGQNGGAGGNSGGGGGSGRGGDAAAGGGVGGGAPGRGSSGGGGGGGFGGGGGGNNNRSGGAGGNGGFGGGSGWGVYPGNAGFGGGGGAYFEPAKQADAFGGGLGASLQSTYYDQHGGGPTGGGGGGLGAGGDIFVQQGGGLTIESGTLGAGTVTGGNSGGGAATSGRAYGSGIFLQGNEPLTLSPASGQSLTIAGVIADETGSHDASSITGAGALVINGAGTVLLDAVNTYTGGTSLDEGTLHLGAQGAAGTGGITFGGGELQFSLADLPTNTISGIATGLIDITDLAYDPAGSISLNLATNVLTITEDSTTITLNIAGGALPANEALALARDGTGTAIEVQQTIAVSTEAALNQAIATANAATAGNFVIDITGSITESGTLTGISLAAGVELIIEGAGNTLNGAGTYAGLYVHTGNVTIDDLTITDAVARGGAGSVGSDSSQGGGGGGGAGVGGGLLVGSGATVALEQVSFSSDSAIGGAGGSYTGGHGGNGGAGGTSSLSSGGGGGGGSGTYGAGGIGGPGAQNGGTGGRRSSSGGGGGAGGFGGGGGGAGAGDYNAPPGAGGFGGGNGGQGSGSGGGGLGAGGDIFVQSGGSLLIEGGTLGAGTVQGGSGGPYAIYGGSEPQNGESFGSAIFLQGNTSQILAPASGETLTVAGVIADQSGSGGTGANAGSGAIVIDGAGTVLFDAANTYEGGTTIEEGRLVLGAAGAAGSGAITFGTGDPPSLSFTLADAPTNTIDGFVFDDTIDITDLTITSPVTLTLGTGDILSETLGGQTLNLTFSSADTDAQFTLTSDGTGGAILTDNVPCFLAGTAIATPQGEALVEHLRIGDEVLGADGSIVPVRWIGIHTVARRFADPLRYMPIRIRAGALGENLPQRDLLVSPDHAMYLGGILIQAAALVNGSTILRETRMPERFVYYHVEVAAHALILAEGAATESFVDNADRMAFDNWAEHEALYGNLSSIPEMNHPRAKSARQIPMELRQFLEARATSNDTALSA